MASKNTAVNKGDRAELAYDRLMLSQGWKALTKSTRTMVKIKGRFVQKHVDLFGAFDRVYVKNDSIEFAQVTDRHNLASHRIRIEQKFPVIFTIPNVRITIPLWSKEQHGNAERYVFDIVEWVYSPDMKKMVWVVGPR